MNPPFTISNNWGDFPMLQGAITWRAGDGRRGICFVSGDDRIQRKIRLNDFPDEPLYTLIEDNAVIIHFDDWPELWLKPEMPEMHWEL